MNTDHYCEFIEGMEGRWAPHPAQKAIGHALFDKGIKQIFCECGRNFGKTDLIGYCLWRYAKTFPGSENYYFAPLANQATEIIWSSQRIQDFGVREWLHDGPKGVNNSEHRLRFKHNSFIKLDGADNVNKYRGVKMKGLTVYDEYKDFRPGFHDAMDPNYDAHDAPLIIIGTPPEIAAHHFYDLAEDFKLSPSKAYFKFTSLENPHIPRHKFEEKKAAYYRKGDGDIWEREYMCNRVFGGKKHIFPMLSADHKKPHREVMKAFERDKKRMQWVVIADPGTTTCSAMLFGCLNPYTKILYILDEIYETDQKETSVGKLGPRFQGMKQELNPRYEWLQGADEAAAWYRTEMVDQWDENFFPTEKSLNKKESGINLIKDLLLQNRVVISDRCKNLFWEMSSYIKDDKGKIPKENDHLIDCFRYMLALLGFSINEEERPVEKEEAMKETKRFYTPDEDLRVEGAFSGEIDIDMPDY